MKYCVVSLNHWYYVHWNVYLECVSWWRLVSPGACVLLPVFRRNVLVQSALKEEAVRCSETLVPANHIAWNYIPEYRNLHCRFCDKRCRLRTSANVCTAQAEGVLRAVWLTHCFSSYRFVDRTGERVLLFYYIIIIIINCKWVFTRWQWYNNKTTDKIQAYYNKTTCNINTRQQTITQDNRQL
jgi:hypothetical protein